MIRDALLALGTIALIVLAASWVPAPRSVPTAIPAAAVLPRTTIRSTPASGNPSGLTGASEFEDRRLVVASGPTLATTTGYAGWATTRLGPRYLAMRLPRGTVVTICAVRCWTGAVTDYGPSSRIKPTRVADIALHNWMSICGLAARAGLCLVTVSSLPPAPATDVD